MRATADVVIVGGGIIGLTAAYELAPHARVTIIERGAFGQESSWAGAGILLPAPHAEHLQPIDHLRRQSAMLFPELASRLRAETGIDNGYRQSGGLRLIVDDTDQISEWQRQGVIMEEMSATAVRDREPKLDPPRGRYFFFPEMAQVRNPRHVRALEDACRLRRVTMLAHTNIEKIDCSGGRLRAIETSAGRLEASHFVIAAGAWSTEIMRSLGIEIGVKPVRGQIALLGSAPQILKHIFFADKLYLVPRDDGHILVGSTEEDVGFDKRTTARAIAELLSFAQRIAPALGLLPVERTWAGLRPGSVDELPYIGRAPTAENLFVATGHFRSGIELSPGTARIVRALVLGETPEIPVEAFRLDRHGNAGSGKRDAGTGNAGSVDRGA
jgi:glycine oxidase